MCAKGTRLGLVTDGHQSSVEFLMHRPKRRESLVQTDPEHSWRALRRKDAAIAQCNLERSNCQRRFERVENGPYSFIGDVADESNRQMKIL